MHALINSAQSRALAMLVDTLRTDWDVPGIAAAISRAKHRAPVDELAIALIRLTNRADLRSPALLVEDGPHWRGLEEAAKTLRPADLARCVKDGHERALLPCRLCASEHKALPDDAPPPPGIAPDPEQADINARGARRARAALTTKTTTERTAP